jgi:hypothetical protein
LSTAGTGTCGLVVPHTHTTRVEACCSLDWHRMWTYPPRWWYIRQEQYSTHPFCISFLLFVFVLFAPSDTGLIFRSKFKTSVSSSPFALLWQLLLLLLLKPLLTLAYSEIESNCVYKGSWRNWTYFPVDGWIQPHYPHLQGCKWFLQVLITFLPCMKKSCREALHQQRTTVASSLEFCPSFSVHEHHESTFSPCLRLVHHERVESCVVEILSKF